MESFESQVSQSMGRPVHGSIKPAELRHLGLDPAQVIDFSASISPIGPPPGLWEALRKIDLTTYPDPECLELREALSSHLGIGLEHILVGNGTTEIIHLLTRAYLPTPENKEQNSIGRTDMVGRFTGRNRKDYDMAEGGMMYNIYLIGHFVLAVTWLGAAIYLDFTFLSGLAKRQEMRKKT